MHAFSPQKIIIIILIHLNPNQSLHQTETEIAYLGKLIRDIFQATDRGNDLRNGIWNDPIGLLMLSEGRRLEN